MPKGRPKNWTLDQLRRIWEFDGDNGTMTITEAARQIGISHSHWYSMRARLQSAGSPEALFEEMQKAKKHRYNRTSTGKAREGSKIPDTLEDALTRIYTIRVSGAGRGGMREQFTATIPPLLAEAFIIAHGREIVYEPREEGILIKPVPPFSMPELPMWLEPHQETGHDA